MTAAASRYGGWSVKYWDAMMGDVMGEIMGRPFDLLLGRRTYDIFAGYWPNAGDEPVPSRSTTPPNTSCPPATRAWMGPSELIEGDVPPGSRRSRRATGESSRCTAAGT